MKAETMMKWRVRRQSKCSSNSEVNEDVRRSLEILDNVLAEFDDHDIFSSPAGSADILVNGDEQGSPLSHAHQEKERWEDENGNKLEQSNLASYHCSPNGNVAPEVQSLVGSTDGTTSQHSSLLDESRRCSAPPVPKRSPGTRLSNRDRRFFPKEGDGATSQMHRSHHSLGHLQLGRETLEQSSLEITEGKRKAALSVPTPGTSSSSSPVDDNAQISNRLRHKEITGEDPCLEFYLVRDDEDAADDEVFLSSPQRVDREMRCKSTTCRICGENLDRGTSISAPTASCDTRKFPMDSRKPALPAEAHLRRMRLDKKFAKVKLLLKTNQVTGLDKPPPSFKPPPPPARGSDKALVPPRRDESNTSTTRGIGDTRPDSQPEKTANNTSTSEPLTKQRPHLELSKETRNTNGRANPGENKSDVHDVSHYPERIKVVKSPCGLLTEDVTCAKCEKTSSHELNHSSEIKAPREGQDRDSNKTPPNQNLLSTDVLCENCINKGWTFRSLVFVSQSPSSLKRPPLGLSYSMEDDLSPGIKEISISPPKTVDTQSDSLLSSPKSSPVAHMSTFSHSASSLGDGSSQSDLDFSTSMDSGKVPLTSIKSLTLPTDMKLGPSPFYSAMEGEKINGTDTKLGVSGLEATRSSSAPPPLQDKGHWKKDKTGFSRKDKQNNDGADISRQAQEEEVSTEEKPKKKSVWKSILRRK